MAGQIFKLALPIFASIVIFALIVLLPFNTKADFDPYQVLGVSRDASLTEIKQAYRDLAKQAHPDKTNFKDQESGNKFIEINKAFQILKDSEKRRRYDQLGFSEDNRHTREQSSRGYMYTSSDGFRTFTFFSSPDGHLRKRSISTQQYYNEYLEASKYGPFFIFFYSDFCAQCNFIEATWTRITDSLEKFNVGSFSINVYREPKLALDLGVSTVPHIACLINGKVRPFRERELSRNKVINFVRSLMPHDLVPTLYREDMQDKFISSAIVNNRLCALIISNQANLKLRHLLMAFALRDYYKFAHVSTQLSHYSSLITKYKIDVDNLKKYTYVLTFDENFSSPLSVTKLPNNQDYDATSIKDQLLKWPFIQLPRLMSQKRFDDICLNSIPQKNDQIQKKLCIILFAQNIPKFDKARQFLRDFIKLNKMDQNFKLIFSFLDPSKQQKFVQHFLEETKQSSSSHNEAFLNNGILLIERNVLDRRKAHYKYLNSRWDPDLPNEIDKAKIELYDLLQDYKLGNLKLTSKVVLIFLEDEEGPSLLERIYQRLKDFIISTIYYLFSGESPTTLLLLFIGPLLFAMYFAPSFQSFASSAANRNSNGSVESENITEPTAQHYSTKLPRNYDSQAHNRSSQQQPKNHDLKLIELKAETYNGMVRLLRPGFRSIVLLCDHESMDVLLPKFKSIVWPYRRNKTLLFGYLLLDKNLDWFKQVLQQALCYEYDEILHVNQKNCIGTVLSLNGFKRYFRVYHAKHSERSIIEKDDSGAFLGFDDDGDRRNSNDDAGKIEDIETGDASTHVNSPRLAKKLLPVHLLLNGLSIWLDKMFDGLTKKYLIDSWPEDIK